jgi:hypothetical protein
LGYTIGYLWKVLRDMGYKKVIALVIIVILAVGVFLFLRGPYVSNLLKKAVLPELGAVTGRQLVARKIYLNLLPLFVEAKGVKMFNEEGERVFAAERVKGYLNLSGILRRQIEIRRIIVKAPSLWTDREQVSEIIDNIRKYQSRERPEGKGPFRVTVGAVQVVGGEVSFYDTEYGAITSAKGIDGEVIIREEPELRLSVSEFDLAVRDFKPVRGQLKGSAKVGKEALDLRNLQIMADGVALEGSGSYSREGTGKASITLDVPVESVKEIFGLENPGSGVVHASGEIRVSEGFKDPYLDMEVDGELHLQTLLELLKAGTGDDLQGLVDFDGQVKGHLSDITGSAEARLREGSIYGIKTDDLKCRLSYKDGIMGFHEGRGELYGGKATAEASITLPVVESFTLNVDFSEVDSPPVLDLVGLGGFNIPFGKVNGHLSSSGGTFSPAGWAEYRALEGADDFIGRIREIRGNYRYEGNLVTITEASMKTDASHIQANGSIDLAEDRLALVGRLVTSDVKDLTSPYFTGLSGSGEFEGGVSGKFDDPLIEGSVRMSAAALDDYLIGDVEGEVSYEKHLLQVRDLQARREGTVHRAEGSVEFPGAENIFDLRDPRYKLTVFVTNGDIKELATFFGLDVPVMGAFDSKVDIKGTGGNPVFTGDAQTVGAIAYGVPVSSASLRFSYEAGEFTVMDSIIRKESSTLRLKGTIDTDGKFDLTAHSRRLLLSDIVPDSLPVNYKMEIEAEGKGTFDEPEIRVTAKLRDGEFRGAGTGGGTVRASLKGRDVAVEAGLLDGKMVVNGVAHLSGEMPWSAEVTLGAGRYDVLLRPFLKEVPEDMLLDMDGTVSLSGTRSHVEAYATLTRMHAMLYGYGFSNEGDIKVSMDDNRFYFLSLNLRSGNTYVSVGGDIELGASFNVVVEGSTSLLPFKSLSKEIQELTGDVDFVLALRGPWTKPTLNGGIDITDASLAVKKIPKRFGSINGYIFVDEDRVVIQRIGATFGGGDLELTGVVKLEGFSMKEFYLDALLNDVTVNPSEGFVANLGGNILFRGSPEGGDITGELNVNRARYRERLEWKSWLLRARPKVLPRAELGWADKIELNVKIYGAENITIDNNIARAPLKIDMVLRGTLGSPVLLGRVESREGEVYFRNNEFRILHATADFTDIQRTSPYIDIFAETSSKGYHIWLSLQGRVEQFDLTLTSDPPLGEVEILALLTVGEFGEGLSGLEGGVGAAEATSFLTGKFQDVIEERLKNITGFSRFQIDPYVSKSTGTVTPRITVSKRLMSDQMFVTYSTAVGATEEQELKLEYLLSNHVSLLGVRDELGTLGGDIKFRFEFK